MKKLTKLTALLLTVLLLVSAFAACDIDAGEGSTESGSESQKTDSTSTESSKPTDAPSSAPTNEPSDEPTFAPTDEPSDEPTSAPTDAPTSAPTEDESEDQTEDPNKAEGEYTISVKTIGGRPIPNLTLFIYVEDDLVNYAQTDENGVATVKLDKADNYTVELPKNSLEGYIVEDRYALDSSNVEIVLTSSVIPDSNLTGVSYKVGNIMHDFTVTLTDGSTLTLSEVLKEKKGVLINFWFSTCSPCISEFPYLVSAYEKYKDAMGK